MDLTGIRQQIHTHFFDELIPFWKQRGIDRDCGGYLTCFDAEGNPVLGAADKFLVMQTRMVWAFSYFSRFLPDDASLKDAARQGVDFLIRHMWDETRGGWYWRCARDGQVIDTPKIMYGHSFAIYGLAEYFLATGDPRGLDYARRTFDVVHQAATDVAHGGYHENFSREWAIIPGRHYAEDRKSLNTSMHLMEAFTTLVQASGEPLHARRLGEVTGLILQRMINPESGAGYDRFDLAFTPQTARRIALPADGQSTTPAFLDFDPPLLMNSYGHDAELAWLLRRTGDALGQPGETYLPVMRRLVDHVLAYGLDREYGGVYRDGQHNGPALVTHKEWWQQAEPLVAYLDLYELTHESRYLDAFQISWDFITRHMINHAVGEWRTILTREGAPIYADLGHEWKAAYHTARAMGECLRLLDRIV